MAEAVPANGKPLKIGVISDTHNTLNETALRELGGVDMILHAGDVTDRVILDELCQIAPVRAVRGNCDFYEPAYKPYKLAESLEIELGGYRVFMVHQLSEADPNRLAPELQRRWKSWQPQITIFGHTHRPEKIEKGETLYFNPGSPSLPRRSEASIGILHLWPEGIVAEHIVVS